jgi:hypothetical protein
MNSFPKLSVSKSDYDKLIDDFYIKACSFYSQEKYEFYKSSRKLNNYIRIILVKEKKSSVLYAACIIGITSEELPINNVQLNQVDLAFVSSENQSEITRTDIALFQVNPYTMDEVKCKLYSIASPRKIHKAWKKPDERK